LSTRIVTALKTMVDSFRRVPLDFEYAVNKRPISLNEINYETTDLVVPNWLSLHTFILYESFVPRHRYTAFVRQLPHIMGLQYGVSVVNISVRVVGKDDTTFLNYAKHDAFAFVFYLKVFRVAEHRLRVLTHALNDLTLKCGGTFYLPYRFHYTRKQLLQAYPNVREFLARKKALDPQDVFSNTFYTNLKTLLADTRDT